MAARTPVSAPACSVSNEAQGLSTQIWESPKCSHWSMCGGREGRRLTAAVKGRLGGWEGWEQEHTERKAERRLCTQRRQAKRPLETKQGQPCQVLQRHFD